MSDEMNRPANKKNKPEGESPFAAFSRGFRARLEEGKTMGDYEREEQIKKAKEQSYRK